MLCIVIYLPKLLQLYFGSENNFLPLLFNQLVSFQIIKNSSFTENVFIYSLDN